MLNTFCSNIFDYGFSGVKERIDWNTFVTAGEWIGRVDVRIACDAGNNNVNFACDGRWCLFADFTHPDALVAGRVC